MCHVNGPFFILFCFWRVMVFNTTCNNIPVILQWLVLLLDETRVTRENHQPAPSHWEALSHNVVSNSPLHEWDSNTDCIGSCKSNYIWSLHDSIILNHANYFFCPEGHFQLCVSITEIPSCIRLFTPKNTLLIKPYFRCTKIVTLLTWPPYNFLLQKGGLIR